MKCYVRLGYDITKGEDIENAIKELAGTHIANLQPNRESGKNEKEVFFLVVLFQTLILNFIIKKNKKLVP